MYPATLGRRFPLLLGRLTIYHRPSERVLDPRRLNLEAFPLSPRFVQSYSIDIQADRGVCFPTEGPMNTSPESPWHGWIPDPVGTFGSVHAPTHG